VSSALMAMGMMMMSPVMISIPFKLMLFVLVDGWHLLLGSLVVSQLWQAALGRAAVPGDKRAPIMIFIDEFQDYLHLPTDVADVLAQARGLGVGLTLAHQHLAQLPPSLRSAVLANARSRVCFQLGSEDARLVAGTSADVEAIDLLSSAGPFTLDDVARRCFAARMPAPAQLGARR